MPLKYYIKDHGSTAEDAREINPPTIEQDPQRFAELAAEHCFHRRDGWEWSWPITFTVITEDGKEHTVEVECATVPEFRAITRKPVA